MVSRISVVLGHIHFPRDLATGLKDSLQPYLSLKSQLLGLAAVLPAVSLSLQVAALERCLPSSGRTVG